MDCSAQRARSVTPNAGVGQTKIFALTAWAVLTALAWTGLNELSAEMPGVVTANTSPAESTRFSMPSPGTLTFMDATGRPVAKFSAVRQPQDDAPQDGAAQDGAAPGDNQPESEQAKGAIEPDQESTDDQSNDSSDSDADSDNPSVPRASGQLIRIPMPIVGNVADRVIASLERVLEKQQIVDGGTQPILVIEFDNRNGTNGIGSDFEDCLKIARFLTGPRMNKFRTVAYLPGPSDSVQELFADGKKKQSTFESHVVLVALSCQEIVMHRDSAIGNAGIDMENVDELFSTAYRVMAGKRRVFPPLVALAMLEKSRVVYRVEIKDEGFKYVEEDEYQRLINEAKVIEAITLSGPNNFAFFSSEDLLNYRLIRHRVDSRRELADRYNLNPTALEGDPSLGKEWNAVRMAISGNINSRMVTWIENALGTRVNPEEINMIIVEIDSAGGEPEAAIRLANRLSQFDPMKVRTVAFVPDRAKGIASIVAMGCDHLVMTGESTVGGDSRPEITPQQLDPIKEALQELAENKETNWSVFYGLVDTSFEVKQFKNRRTGRMRIMSDEEKDATKSPEQWQEIQTIDLVGGIDGETADNLGLTRGLVEDFAELKSFYQITNEPTLLEPTLADRWVETFAHQLASPRVAWMVLFGAIFFLSMEFSNPGLGVPGFLSAICWMLFFWSQYFDGNASVLEILLFLVGIVFILIEFFVLPGFGIFGIGGAIMVTISIILAVQTFVIPSSAAEVAKLKTSLLTFVGASSGFFVALFIFRHYVHRIPMLNRLMLDPNEHFDDEFSKEKRESLVDFEALTGKSGVTQTRLAPSGKALIGHELYNVITDGRMIDKGAEIVVKQVVGNRIIVAEFEN